MGKLTVLAGSTVYFEYKPCGGISWDLWTSIYREEVGGAHCSPPEGYSVTGAQRGAVLRALHKVRSNCLL